MGGPVAACIHVARNEKIWKLTGATDRGHFDWKATGGIWLVTFDL